MGNCGASLGDRGLRRAERGTDFSYDGRRFLAKVVDCYDGDTIRVVFRYRGELVQYRARMAGYDSPEMKPLRSSPTRDAEKTAAVAARDALAARIMGRLVRIDCGGFDKYGRLLVAVVARDESVNRWVDVNQWMVASGHGVPYDGGHKAAFSVPGATGAAHAPPDERADPGTDGL